MLAGMEGSTSRLARYIELSISLYEILRLKTDFVSCPENYTQSLTRKTGFNFTLVL